MPNVVEIIYQKVQDVSKDLKRCGLKVPMGCATNTPISVKEQMTFA